MSLWLAIQSPNTLLALGAGVGAFAGAYAVLLGELWVSRRG